MLCKYGDFMKTENVKTSFYTAEDCVPYDHYINFTSKILVIRPDCLAPSSQQPKYQLFKCSFEGHYPSSRKNTRLIGHYLVDGVPENALHRSHIVGILKPEIVAELGI